MRYATTSNTVYLTGGKVFTPTRIAHDCPGAPLRLTDPRSKTWDLAADLVVQDGSTLSLKGTRAGGDVNTLRIRSMASNTKTQVQQITAAYGTIDIASTAITSWDPVARRPDTTVTLPVTSLPTDRGRAFIRVQSRFAADGTTAQESALTVRDSRISYLGYDGAEAYGVTLKAEGCDRHHLVVCAKLKVGGQEIGSTFDHNYIGTYTWGANGMLFRGNTYRDNLSYGLDSHDVSSRLTIDRNRFSYNGNHGLICSQRCDRLRITGNRVDHNGFRPSRAGGPHNTEVHGIMLHRGVTRTVVSGNVVTDQPSGAGIALFDCSGDTVSGNRVSRNLYGIRLTVGSSGNSVKDNIITGSTENAILLMRTTDPAVYSTLSGRPTNNSFQDNTISGTGSYGVRFVDADGNRIHGKSMTGLGGPLLFSRASGTVLGGVTLPARQPIVVTGTVTRRTTLKLGLARRDVVVTADKQSTVTWR